MDQLDTKTKYFKLLAAQYPTVQDVCTEIINLQAILNLPKGTEHFMSDLHGEYEAFYHILNNCSGVVREKVDLLFENTMSESERSELCTLIYYPTEKLKLTRETGRNSSAWYRFTLQCMIQLAKMLSSKYTRSKVRKAMPKAYAYILDELLHAQPDEDNNQLVYHDKIIDTLIGLGSGDDFIEALAMLIKRLAVDHLHIVGDIFDRGPRPDTIIEFLMGHHSFDIEWGNHDILWMGAAAGSEACVATVVRNSVSHHNMDVLEKGYAISLRPLTLFAQQTYSTYTDPNKAALEAISVILFKIEGQIIQRHPEYHMEDRLLLDKINYSDKTVRSYGRDWSMRTVDFPTVDPSNPYVLTADEQTVLTGLKNAFCESERLDRHIRFLYETGSVYLCFNQNLLFHGCIPMNEHGQFESVSIGGQTYKGKAYMDAAERIARRAYFGKKSLDCLDFMWYLWCGSKSPLCGRTVKTFERMWVEDPAAWVEPQNDYYVYCQQETSCRMVLREFGLYGEFCHIINGHLPVKVIRGERPVKGDGVLITIDGGFCRAYQKTTGIAGYTLIFNSHGLRLMSHQPFKGKEDVLEANGDMQSQSEVIATAPKRVLVMDTDNGHIIRERIADLEELMRVFRAEDLDGHL
ncbi:MAG: fructose-1,6-bisphosphatase [Ethanoligenens sp.]